MLEHIFFIYPLAGATREHYRSLSKVLWGWQLCTNCETAQECHTSGCMWQMSPNLAHFFHYYQTITAAYIPDLASSSKALQSHADLFAVIEDIKRHPDLKRSAITVAHFLQRAVVHPGRGLPSTQDQNQAFGLAARVLSMVPCIAENQTYDRDIYKELPVLWSKELTFAEFLEATFPAQNTQTLVLDGNNMLYSNSKREKLTAKSLMNISGLKMLPTNNLHHHLRLDITTKTVAVYHHTAVLKQHLRGTLNTDESSSMAKQIQEYVALRLPLVIKRLSISRKLIRTSGNIPRDLALETLVTIQEVLFPLDSESRSLLHTLVSKDSFDPDCLCVDTQHYRRPSETRVPLRYWGARLEELYEQMENPKASGYFEKWIERRSGARYVMMATLAGVTIAIVLGVLSLAVSIFQAWVGYQQWQHPVNPA